MTIPKTIHFKIDKTVKITTLLHFIWDMALVIAILVLAQHAKAATIPVSTRSAPESSSDGGLSSLFIPPTPSKDLIKQIEEAQKPPPPPPEAPAVVEPAPALEPVTQAVVASYGNNYAWGNCTWGVANWVHVPNNLHNAYQWDDNAAAMGFTVTPIPKPGAVAQTDAGYLGHVALVETVDGPNVLIKEMNAQGLGVTSERWVNASSFNYIYF